MILGQITQQFYIQPTGYVNSFAIRFYPNGLANFVPTPIRKLTNTETSLALVFGEEASGRLAQRIAQTVDTKARIKIIENFLLDRLKDNRTIDAVVQKTIDTLFETKGSTAIKDIFKNDFSRKRQLERYFVQNIGISPKQLGKVIRLQAALNMMLNRQSETLTDITYKSEYYDQSHFVKDFKRFTGTTPKKFLGAEEMALSSLFYK
ncbi:helix-turn-helix domain-containing protein [Vacuolonema iberomarrocanum]|uniref:helix-turn-helix domain-containing protein n=1 Tax=Vacuolonema iberomarrocanum TaxID=3454632 RepID=UPI003F6E1F36